MSIQLDNQRVLVALTAALQSVSRIYVNIFVNCLPIYPHGRLSEMNGTAGAEHEMFIFYFVWPCMCVCVCPFQHASVRLGFFFPKRGRALCILHSIVVPLRSRPHFDGNGLSFIFFVGLPPPECERVMCSFWRFLYSSMPSNIDDWIPNHATAGHSGSNGSGEDKRFIQQNSNEYSGCSIPKRRRVECPQWDTGKLQITQRQQRLVKKNTYTHTYTNFPTDEVRLSLVSAIVYCHKSSPNAVGMSRDRFPVARPRLSHTSVQRLCACV